MTGTSYGLGELGGHVDVWLTAADLARTDGDLDAAVDEVAHDALDLDTLITRALVGATLIARRVAEAQGRTPLVRPDGEQWVIEPADGQVEPDAAHRLSATLVTALANGDPEGAGRTVVAYARPCTDAARERMVALLARLLGTYVDVDDALNQPRPVETRRAHGDFL